MIRSNIGNIVNNGMSMIAGSGIMSKFLSNNNQLTEQIDKNINKITTSTEDIIKNDADKSERIVNNIESDFKGNSEIQNILNTYSKENVASAVNKINNMTEQDIAKQIQDSYDMFKNNESSPLKTRMDNLHKRIYLLGDEEV